MFRGLRKRAVSTAHLEKENAEKENGHAGAPKTSKSAAKRASVFQDNDRNKNSRMDEDFKGKKTMQLQAGPGVDSAEMTNAFDQLLVSSTSP